MGLMKLATYYRDRGDDVRFFKGDLKGYAAQLLCEEFLSEVNDHSLGRYIPKIIDHIRTGKLAPLADIPYFSNTEQASILQGYRTRYREGQFRQFDIVAVTTLFTFYWRETIDTINFAKKFCSSGGKLLVGGISASILHDQLFEETGIHSLCGLLNTPGILDDDSDVIIDHLPLDYSILEEIDYQYPCGDAYLAYMTRGCPRKCVFCSVPRLEPEYKPYICLKDHINITSARFGPKKDLLLMDNNVFASDCFTTIIDEIKECGFGRGAMYTPTSEYEIAMKNLKDGYNVRAYIKKFIRLYNNLSSRLQEEQQGDFYLMREQRHLLYPELTTVDAIIDFDDIAKPLYEKHFKPVKRSRTIDFNQGVDARLATDSKMSKLAEINIRPLRVAFDHYSLRDTYTATIRSAAKSGISNLANYLLYNFEDHPDELYYRLKINIDLCDELGIKIYSFPMKYHPIEGKDIFNNREYLGKHWNRKFIRSVQAVLNATKGKIGCGKSFFNEAFGNNIDEFHKILWMPEALIINRLLYKDNLTRDWWSKYIQLDKKQLINLHGIVSTNLFHDQIFSGDRAVDEVLRYYYVKRSYS
jgi:hypothetical protein